MKRAIDVALDVGYARNVGDHDGQSVELTGIGTFIASENWTTTWYGGHAAYHLIDFPGQPYVLAGGGVYRIKYRLDALQPSPTHLVGGDAEGARGGLNVGLGASTHVTRGSRLGMEGVFHRVFVSQSDVAFFTVGATLSFGAPK